MRHDFPRLLLFALVFAFALPSEMASAKGRSGTVTKKIKKQGKRQRRKKRRGKKIQAAETKKNVAPEIVPAEPNPFAESPYFRDGDTENTAREEADAGLPADDNELENEAKRGKESDGVSEGESPANGWSLNGGESSDVEADGSLRRSGRMEFDERLVKGQAAKSGAVYLFKRMPRRLPGLIPLRRSYRRRIVEPVLGARPLKPIIFSSGDTTTRKKILTPIEDQEEIEEPQTVEKKSAETE